MRGKNLDDMPVKDLRMTVMTLSGGKGGAWPREKCARWLKQRHIDTINVGDFCRLLLRVVVGKNREGFCVGLSHRAMLRIVQAHFPQSAVNVLHFSWYATTMRSRGEMIPVYRK